jgi:hypothetical protein
MSSLPFPSLAPVQPISAAARHSRGCGPARCEDGAMASSPDVVAPPMVSTAANPHAITDNAPLRPVVAATVLTTHPICACLKLRP